MLHYAAGLRPITSTCAIERAQATPKQGASSGFKYGRAVGPIEATVAGCGIPLTILEPRAWQFHISAATTKNLAANVRCSCFHVRTPY